MSLASVPDYDTVPPQALEAEESVLGAAMISPNAIDACTEILEAGDFYRESHARIWRAALSLYAKGESVDAITLTDALKASGELEQIGGAVRLYELAALVPATANVRHYASIVKENSTLRRLIRAGGEISRLGWERPGEASELVDRAEQIVFDLSKDRLSGDTVQLGQTIRETYDELVALDGQPRGLIGAPSGLIDLDRVTRGFRPGDLTVVAADTGRGKSALALNIALYLAVQKELPVAFFSLEMSKEELALRALSLVAGVSHERLETGEIRKEEWAALELATKLLGPAPIMFKGGDIRPATVRSEIRRWKTRNPKGALAIVDYLQLLTPDEKTDNRTVDVSSISRALKVTAMSLGLPILAVSQLKRRMPNTRPHRNDLRESGSIENDSSVVILIHHEEDKPGVAELIVAKNRHGAERTVQVHWQGERMHFSDLARVADMNSYRAAA